MTDIITKDTIESNAHNNVISYLDNRTYIKDPKDKQGGHNRQFVYEIDPLDKEPNYGEMPYIICEFPTVEYDKTSADGKIKTISWMHRITVRTSKTGQVNFRGGRPRNDMLEICDDLHALFNSETRKQELRKINMFNIMLVKTGVDATDVYEATFELKYDLRLQVSS